MNLNVIKLWKQILKLASIMTDKAELIVESELAEGVEVYVERDGEYIAAEDGEYEAEDKIIVVADGRVAEIRVKEEPKPEEEVVEENLAEEEVVIEEPQTDERDARIAELEARVAELENLVGEKDNRIAELEAELANRDNELEELRMSADIPAKEAVKKEEKTGALRFFN